MSQFEYTQKILELIQKTESVNAEAIAKAAEIFARTTREQHIIHTFGTGHSHMIGIELFCRAGGLANVDAMLDPDTLTSFGTVRSGNVERLPGLADIIYDNYKIAKGDIMIISSNSGRNAVPIEMAMRCQKEGIYTIAITNLNQSKNSTSRHASGKRLFECADLIIDTCVPVGDAMMEIGKAKTGPASSIIGMYLVDTIFTEALKLLEKNGDYLPVLMSQNVDGYDNTDPLVPYKDRIKHY